MYALVKVCSYVGRCECEVINVCNEYGCECEHDC